MGQKCAVEVVVCWKSKLIVNVAPCWAWLARYSWPGPAVVSSCVTLNLGNIPFMGFVASKSDTVQLTHLRRGLLTWFAQQVVQRLEVHDYLYTISCALVNVQRWCCALSICALTVPNMSYRAIVSHRPQQPQQT